MRFYAGDLRAVRLRVVFFAVDLRAVDFLPVDFLAVDFLPVDFLAVDFLAVDFLAVDFLAVDFRAVFFAAFFVDFFAARLPVAFFPFAPPSCLLTVAQAMRSAALLERPFFFADSSMCSAWRFCLDEYEDLSPRGMADLLRQQTNAGLGRIAS